LRLKAKPSIEKSLCAGICPQLVQADALSPFTVGNGKFAFTADITGLQTFPDFYEKGIPLATQSEWGWHAFPTAIRHTLDSAMDI